MTTINFQDCKELSVQTGIPLETLQYRSKHMPIEKLLSTQDLRKHNKGNIKHVWNGFKGTDSIAKQIGVSSSTLLKYINLSGGSVDSAIDLINERNERLRNKKRKSQAKPKPKAEFEMPSLGLWSKALGLNSSETSN